MQGGVQDPQPHVARAVGRPEVKHHRVIGHPATLGQDLGVAGMVDPAGVERFLVQGKRDDRVDPAGQSEVGGGRQEVIGRAPARASIWPGRIVDRSCSLASRHGITRADGSASSGCRIS